MKGQQYTVDNSHTSSVLLASRQLHTAGQRPTHCLLSCTCSWKKYNFKVRTVPTRTPSAQSREQQRPRMWSAMSAPSERHPRSAWELQPLSWRGSMNLIIPWQQERQAPQHSLSRTSAWGLGPSADWDTGAASYPLTICCDLGSVFTPSLYMPPCLQQACCLFFIFVIKAQTQTCPSQLHGYALHRYRAMTGLVLIFLTCQQKCNQSN